MINTDNHSNKTTMKTILSIPGNSATSVLKSLHNNSISSNYMGLDQSGRLIMEINYEPEQTNLIKEINEYMDACESLLAEVTNAVNKAIETRNSQIYKLIEDMKKRREERERKENLIIE